MDLCGCLCIDFSCRSLAGEYSDAFGLLEESQRIEEQELGARPDRMADLLYSLADTKSEVRCMFLFSC